MFLVRLTYASTANNLDPEEIASILATAQKFNKSKDITGMLCFSRKYFLQSLEGSRQAVNTLYSKICLDKRHSKMLLLDYGEISKRDFPSWSMAYVPEKQLTKEICLTYSLTDEFNPYKLSQASAHDLMLELKKVLPQEGQSQQKIDIASKSA